MSELQMWPMNSIRDKFFENMRGNWRMHWFIREEVLGVDSLPTGTHPAEALLRYTEVFLDGGDRLC